MDKMIDRDPFEIIINCSKKNPDKLLKRKSSMENIPWHLLIKNNSKQRALDLGCGMGFSTISLSEIYSDVYACDLCLENLQFIRNRARYLSRNNIKYACGFDAPHFSFKDNFFDVIFLNGVLEHVGNNFSFKDFGSCSNILKLLHLIKFLSGRTNPREAQSRFLGEIFRVLKHDGTLFIGIENRLSYRYFLGLPEDHILIKYVSLMPRIIANCYSVMHNRVPYLNYTYSILGYEKLLKRSGFSVPRFFSMIPNYSSAKEIIDINQLAHFRDKNTFFVNKVKKRFILKKFVKNTKIVKKYMAHCFGIAVRKDDKIESTIDEIIIDIRRKLNNRNWEISDSKYIITEKGAFIVKLSEEKGSKKGIIKIGLNESACRQLYQNYNAISYIHENSQISENFKKLVPKPIIKDEHSQYRYFMEEFKNGKPATFSSKNLTGAEKLLLISAKALQQFHSVTRIEKELNVRVQEKNINLKVSQLKKLLGAAHSKRLDSIGRFLKDNILPENLPVVYKKGDCSASNILASRDYTPSAFIDWDQSERNGFPLVDLINIIESFKRHSFEIGMGHILTDFYFLNKFSHTEEKLIMQYCEKLKIPEKTIFPLIVIYWMDHVNAQNYEVVKYDKKWMENNVFQVLANLQALI